ncbi:MAG: hypothetical protein R2729_15745 [Bryobacteraceae bacterium]
MSPTDRPRATGAEPACGEAPGFAGGLRPSPLSRLFSWVAGLLRSTRAVSPRPVRVTGTARLSAHHTVHLVEAGSRRWLLACHGRGIECVGGWRETSRRDPTTLSDGAGRGPSRATRPRPSGRIEGRSL